MLHQTITAAQPHPHLETAIEAVTSWVDELRTQSALAARARSAAARRAIDDYVAQLTDDIATVARRVDLSAEGLISIVVDRASMKARRGRAEPGRPTMRTLSDRLTKAIAADADAIRELSMAQARRAATAEALRAAQDDCRACGMQI